jgi:hypothetical protein
MRGLGVMAQTGVKRLERGHVTAVLPLHLEQWVAFSFLLQRGLRRAGVALALFGLPIAWSRIYTPEGGRVDLSAGVAEGCAVLRIQDTGPGIPLAERHRVFDPFYRTLGSEQIGSGLGLSIVQAIAHRIGAEIRLDFVDETQTGLSVAVIVPMR